MTSGFVAEINHIWWAGRPRPLRLLLLVAAFSLIALQAVAASDPGLRSRLDEMMTSAAINIPPNVDRKCALDRAVTAYPSVARTVNAQLRFLPLGKERASTTARMTAMLAIATGLKACNPAAAQGAKSGR